MADNPQNPETLAQGTLMGVPKQDNRNTREVHKARTGDSSFETGPLNDANVKS